MISLRMSCIQDYRENNDKYLSLSGESSIFFAEYKTLKLKEWFPKLTQWTPTILDYGCGDGIMTAFVKKIFPHAHQGTPECQWNRANR